MIDESQLIENEIYSAEPEFTVHPWEKYAWGFGTILLVLIGGYVVFYLGYQWIQFLGSVN